MPSETFHADRLTGIGGSDAPVILGLSPYLTPLQLWAVKTGAIESALNYDRLNPDSPNITWGRRLQPLIAQAFREETNREVIEHDDDTLIRHAEIAWLIGHMDGVQVLPGGQSGVFEAKNVIIYKRDRWSDEAPVEAKIQVQHYMAAAGLEFGSIAGLIGGYDFRWDDFHINQRFVDGLLEKEEAFWRLVQQDIPPDPVSRDNKFLNTLVPVEPKKYVVLEEPWQGVDNELQAVRRQIEEKEAELAPLVEKRNELEAKIKQRIGDAEMAELPGGTVFTFKQTNRKEYTVKATSFRTLRRKGVQDHG